MTKKAFTALLTAILIVSSMTSCGSGGSAGSSASDKSAPETGSSETASSSSSETDHKEVSDYTATFAYLVGAEGSDQNEIQQQADALVTKELGFHVELMPLSIGTYFATFSTMMAANEPIDVTPVSGGNLSDGISMGYIADLNQYTEYLEEAFAVAGDYAKVAQINGHLAGIPVNKELNSPMGLIVRKDIMDELGYTADDFSLDEADISTYYKLDTLFDAVKTAHPDMLVIGGNNYLTSVPAAWVDAPGNNLGVLADFGQSDTFTNWYESDQYHDLCAVHKNWYDKGYVSSDAAMVTDSGEVLLSAGNTFSFIASYKPNTISEKQSQTGMEVELIPFAATAMKPSLSSGGLFYGCTTAAGDPEKAAQLLNFVFTNGEINDLINWGIEGKDWVENADGLAEFLEGVDVTNAATHNDFGWAQPNQFAAHPWVGNAPDIWQQYKDYNNSLLPSHALGFSFDSSDLLDPIAACNAVIEEYQKQLGFGTVSDLDASIAEFNEKLYASGMQSIIDEKQAQFDAWKSAAAE